MKFGAVSVTPWRTTLRDVEVALAGTPGVKATADVVTMRPGSGDWPALTAERLHLAVDAGALMALEEFSRSDLIRGLPLTWQRLDISYSNRLTGQVQLDDVSVKGATGVLHAGGITMGARHWDDVTMSARRRGDMLEIALGSETVAAAPLVLGVFPPQTGVMSFIATLQHPPAPTVARALGIGLGPAFEAMRVGGSVSVNLLDDVTKPIWVRLELILGGWPSPASADAAVVLGKTIGLGARAVVAADHVTLTLDPVRMSTSLFTLAGSGRLLLNDGGRLTLDLSGSLTCAQIRGNLAPSDVLTQVSRYLEAAPAKAAERATLRVQLDASLANTEGAHLAWKLDPGCGYAGFSFGTFAP